MKSTGIVYLGIKTDKFDELVSFYRDVMQLKEDHFEPGFATFVFLNGQKIEIYGPNDPYGENHASFTTGPVVGFEVDDIESARAEMEAKGIEFIGSIQGTRPNGSRWSHFRGPDGNIYEIKQRAVYAIKQ